jgi:hypothetical protein
VHRLDDPFADVVRRDLTPRRGEPMALPDSSSLDRDPRREIDPARAWSRRCGSRSRLRTTRASGGARPDRCRAATGSRGPPPFRHRAGRSGRRGTHRYSWQTSKAWAGTCRQFILALADGTVHRANLRFK